MKPAISDFLSTHKLFKIFLFVLITGLTSCLKTEEPSCDYDPCKIKAPDSEIASVQAYLAANNLQAVQHCSGVFYSIEQEGTGSKPTVCSNVDVTYSGKLTDGTVFDATSTPVSFNLSGLINSWKNVLPEVRAGGRVIMYVPPSLGYGNQQVGSIPPNSILIFDVSLFGVR